MSAHNYIRSDSRKYRANCAACVCVFERIILARDHTRREGQVARGETAVVVAAQSPPRFCLTAKRTHTHHMYGENVVYASERSLAEWGQGEDMCWAPLLVSFSLSLAQAVAAGWSLLYCRAVRRAHKHTIPNTNHTAPTVLMMMSEY